MEMTANVTQDILKSSISGASISNSSVRRPLADAYVPNVIVVDDEAISRRLVRVKLQTYGATVVEAADGAEAFRILRSNPFDLAVIDLDMPGMDGLDLIKCVRGYQRLSHIPIIVLTGNESREALDGALTAGATSYLQKPLNWQCFGPHLRHLLDVARRMGTVGGSNPSYGANDR